MSLLLSTHISPAANEAVDGERFRTEHHIPVPAISWERMKNLYSAANDIGMTRAQIDENAGTSMCQMVIKLLGSSSRINATNRQMPDVVLLVGDGLCSSFGLVTARHLANRGVKVTVYISRRKLANLSIHGLAHFKTFERTGSTLLSNTADLPTKSVDLIIDALGSCEPDEVAAIDWCNACRTTKLTFEHPAGVDALTGHHGGSWIKPSMCIGFGLPKVTIASPTHRAEKRRHLPEVRHDDV